MTPLRLAWMAAFAALALLSLLFLASRPPGQESNLTIATDLGSIREAEETLSRLALEARMGQLDTYDPMIAADHKIDRLIAETEGALDAAAYPGREELELYKAEGAQRRTVMAHFESADAIYRNAIAYFPLLSRRVLSAAEQARAPDIAAIVADWEQVVFLHRAGRASDDDVAATEQLLSAAAAEVPALAGDLSALRAHGHTLLDAYRKAGDLLVTILEADRGDRPNAVYRGYIARRDALEARAARIADAFYAAAFLSVLGIALSFLKMSRTTTRLNEANRRLEMHAEELARAQRIAGVGSYTRDFAGNSGTMSAQCRQILGVSDGYALDRAGLTALVHPEDRQRVMATWQKLHDGFDSLQIEHRILRPDGSVRWVHGEAEVTRDAAGAVNGVAGTLHDITDLRAAQAREVDLERQLFHSQRLEALGTLAGGIAHDLNNTLVPILSLTKLTARRLPERSKERDNLAVVLTASERARDLVKQILLFSRKEEPAKQSVYLATVVRDAMRMIRPSLPPTVDVVDMIAETPAVFADAGQLFQVVINLVTNDAQAIGREAGRITVTVSAAPLAGDERGQVLLSVADTGCGINPAQLARIFEPFYTTKPVNEGTGLGLSVVHGIVTSHGGRINVQSAPGEGTTFTVALPAADATEVDATAASAPVLRAS